VDILSQILYDKTVDCGKMRIPVMADSVSI